MVGGKIAIARAKPLVLEAFLRETGCDFFKRGLGPIRA
jgi:hypothetical protein